MEVFSFLKHLNLYNGASIYGTSEELTIDFNNIKVVKILKNKEDFLEVLFVPDNEQLFLVNKESDIEECCRGLNQRLIERNYPPLFRYR
jgi:hypothetical protein